MSALVIIIIFVIMVIGIITFVILKNKKIKPRQTPTPTPSIKISLSTLRNLLPNDCNPEWSKNCIDQFDTVLKNSGINNQQSINCIIDGFKQQYPTPNDMTNDVKNSPQKAQNIVQNIVKRCSISPNTTPSSICDGSSWTSSCIQEAKSQIAQSAPGITNDQLNCIINTFKREYSSPNEMKAKATQEIISDIIKYCASGTAQPISPISQQTSPIPSCSGGSGWTNGCQQQLRQRIMEVYTNKFGYTESNIIDCIINQFMKNYTPDTINGFTDDQLETVAINIHNKSCSNLVPARSIYY